MQSPEPTEPTEPTPRHDGWTPERKARFFDSLATKGNVRLACRRAGMSPEAAYRFKRRDATFARGWAAALVLANDNGLDTLADRAIDGVEEDVWHRGELVGTRRRYDSRLLLAHLARLEKAAADEAAQADAGRFDELVACIVGEFVPEGLVCDDPVLPLDRESAMQRAGEEADRDAEDAGGSHDDCVEAFRAGRRAGASHWDAWVENACDYVDWLTGWDAEPPLPGLPGNPLPEPLEQALAAAAGKPWEGPANSFARTLCGSSTSALARSLAGPSSTFAAEPRSPRADAVRRSRSR
jgi:hypothetical protein